MDTELLRLFVDVAQRGSFAPVARERELDPSSVSRAIGQLEAMLGVRLFQRTTRRMSLTEAGALYLDRVATLADELDEAAEAARSASGEPSGTLRLTASIAFGHVRLVPLLPAFRARHPGLKLDLVLTDANLDLVAERIDLAIRLGPRIEADLIGTRLVETRYRVYASPAWSAAAAPIRAPADLAAHRCLLLSLAGFRSRWRFQDAAGAETEVPVDGDLMVSTVLALRDCALAGMGPALLADWLVGADVAAGRLVELLPGWRATATDFDTAAWLLYPSRAFLPAKVRATIDFLRQHIR